MHDIKWIREHPDDFDRALKRRGLPAQSSTLLALDEQRRAAIQKAEAAQARRNVASRQIGAAKKNKDEAAATALMTEVAVLKDTIAKAEGDIVGLERKLFFGSIEDGITGLASIPNLPAADVPDGADETGNVEHHHFGAKRNYPFQPKQHFDLGEALGFMDFETAAKLSGARFVVLKSGLARMERALGQFMVDLHATEHGYQEIAPPLLVRDEVMYGTAQLPKFEDDQFPTSRRKHGTELLMDMAWEDVDKAFEETGKKKIRDALTAYEPRLRDVFADRGVDPRERLWLIPTAEVPLTNLVREQIREEADLPLRYTAYTPCFRAEAGAAGKDTRGMIRQHQFNKVELVSITTPEQSAEEHERMTKCAETVLQKLELPYRVVVLSTGDMGFAAQKTYDIEVWLPGQGMYREISSCSNCGDFQARRMDARYRTKEGRTVRHVHTLNGSGVPVGRALIAVMENYQDENGRIAVPDVLQGYMGGMKTVERMASGE